MVETKKIGVFGNPPEDLAGSPPGATQYSPLFPGADSLENCAPQTVSAMTMLAPGGTIDRRYTLALALRTLAPHGTLTVMAPKDKGGSRLKKELTEFGCEVSEEAKSHHRICVCRPPENMHSPALENALQEGASHFLEEIGLWTQPGVFSWNRHDLGSSLLLEHLPALAGVGADLGCGIGFLSRNILQSKKVKHLTMLDIDRRAIECAQKNLGEKRVTLQWADLRTAALPANLDFVVTNPPFHDGGIEDQSLGQAFLKRGAEILRQGGSCWLVANRHLPYEAILRSFFGEVKLVAEQSGFKIYEAKK